MFKTRIRLKTITTTTEENAYLASFTPEKGDGYLFIENGKAIHKIYDGTKWNSSSSGDITQEDVDAAIESVRLQVTESSDGNVVVSSLGVAPILYSANTTVTETKTYTYDGNYSASGLVWGKSSSGLNVAVKAGDCPSGTLTIIGQTMEGIVKNNAYLNWDTTITGDMVDESQSNAILINFKNQSRESQAITRAAIIKVAGSYSLQYDGFTDVTAFTESGVYLIDHDSLGADDYTSKLNIEATTSSGGGSDTPTVTSPIDYKGDEILMFNGGMCIGDSITEGMFNYSSVSRSSSYPEPTSLTNSDIAVQAVGEETGNTPTPRGTVVISKYSYPTILNKKGVKVSNLGISGATVSSWLASKGALISNDTKDFAIVQLGINDCLNGVDTTTFSTNMGTLLGKLKAAKIKTFLCTLTPAYSSANSAMAPYNEIIRALVPAFKDTMDIYLIDLAKYSKCQPNTPYVNTHLTALGYTQMANELYAMISYQISQNLDDFMDVQFSGTSYVM